MYFILQWYSGRLVFLCKLLTNVKRVYSRKFIVKGNKMLRDPEQVRKLLELKEKAYDDSNPNQISDLKRFGGMILGTFKPFLKKEVKTNIIKNKGFLPNPGVWRKRPKNKEDKEDKDNCEFEWVFCPTEYDDYVDKFVMSYIDERIIKLKALKECSNIYMIIGWLKKSINWHVIDTLEKEEAVIFTGERLEKLLNSSEKLPFNAIAKDCNGNVISDIELNKHLITKMIIPVQPKAISIYTKGNHAEDGSMINTDIEEKLSEKYVEMSDEVMESIEIIRKNFTEIEKSNPIGAEAIKVWLSNRTITIKQMVEIIKGKFPENKITENSIKQRLSKRDLYDFVQRILKELKVNKTTNEVIECLRKINKISKKEAKKKQKNKNGGEEL